jgi:hypothetical protein
MSTVMTFSGLGDGRPVQMFAASTGLAREGDRLAVAARIAIAMVSNIHKPTPSLPKFHGVFDGYLVPRVAACTSSH